MYILSSQVTYEVCEFFDCCFDYFLFLIVDQGLLQGLRHFLKADAKTQQEDGPCGHVQLCLEGFERLVLLEVVELMDDWSA